jgi:hypothetical protein
MKRKELKKLFVSVPKKGRTEKDIKKSIKKMKAIAEAYEGEKLDIINISDFETVAKPSPIPGVLNEDIYYAGESIKMMAQADVFIGVWRYPGYGLYPKTELERDIAERFLPPIKVHLIDLEIAAPDIADRKLVPTCDELSMQKAE